MSAAEGSLLLMALGIALALGSVMVADAWEGRRFRGRFDCGCLWPSDDDGPQVVTCAHGFRWQFRVWKDWLDRVRDDWDEIEGVDVMDESEIGTKLLTINVDITAFTAAMHRWATAFRYEAAPNWWIYDETDVTIIDEEMPEELRPDGASGRGRQNDAAGRLT